MYLSSTYGVPSSVAKRKRPVKWLALYYTVRIQINFSVLKNFLYLRKTLCSEKNP